MFGISALLFAVLSGASSVIFIDPAIPELTTTSGADLELKCTSDTPAAWVYPQGTSETNSSTKRVTYSQTDDDKYVAVISIHNAHYLDTGFYFCISNQTDSEESKIYIFVRDPTNLLVFNESLYPLITGHEFGEAIIPCKPTSRDVEVKLLKDGDEVDTYFDIYKGYILKNLALTDAAHYLCRASRGDEIKEVYFEFSVFPNSEGINKPIVEVLGSEGSHIVAGQDVDLSCTVIVPLGINVFIEWQIPDQVDKNRLSFSESTNQNMTVRIAKKILNIRNVVINDAGNYSCFVTDHSKNTNVNHFEMKIYSPDETFLSLTLVGKIENNIIQVRAGETEAHWIVAIKAFPSVSVRWFGPENNILSNSDKYEIITDSTQTKVTVKKISIFDSGVYTLEAANTNEIQQLKVTLLVEDQPNVFLNYTEKSFFDINKDVSINCTIVAFPKPNVTWSVQECTQYPSCRAPRVPMDSKPLVSINEVTWLSSVKWYATETSRISCRAQNYLGQKEVLKPFLVSDVNNGFDIWGPRHRVLSSDNILLGCGATRYKYHEEIDWIYRSDKDPEERVRVLVNSPNSGITITRNDTLFSHQTFLHLSDVNSHKSGNYICRAKALKTNMYEEKDFKLLVQDRRSPVFTEFLNMNGSKISIDAGKSISWNCSVVGIPEPEVIWYKDNQILETKNDRVKLENRNQTLRITYANVEDTGVYKCFASNSAGNVSAETTLKIRGYVMQFKFMWWILIGLIILIVICIIVLTIYCMKYKKEQKKRKQLISVGLYNFSEGQVEAIDPNVDIGEQADLLPYDKKWEFPRDKLKLGKQLGSGAFGVVLKGQAYGLGEDNEPVTVAVKMVKKTSDISHVKSLATELKIMAHLGQHLNVVNLLGACTGNVHNRELLVLVEYCRYGNLHKYLQNHRSTFINQINEATGYVDFSNRSALTDLTYLKPNAYYQPNSEQASEYSNGHSAVTYTTSLSTPLGEDGYLLNRDAEFLAEYHGDYRINSVRPICTQDLFCWGFQVAKGMSYLASRKVLHGDLAARNVLLAEGNIVKICDFGLAKSMYSRENYKNKKRDIPLPVKWMAIEAITDGIFSTQSDIWSYGIFLWELFSLAVTPYPGLYGEVFYQKLLQGYRMEKPKYATEDVYNLMLECWKEKPMLRPSFDECAERLGQMLGQNVKQHYLDLNNPYLNLNAQLSSESDPLSKMVQPTYENCLSAGLPDNTPEGYVLMKKGNERDEPQNEMELKPMLLPGCNSFLNPGYEDLKKFGAHYYSNLSQDCSVTEVIVDSD